MQRVLFGLGNPGRGYAKTRHNAGWQVLDELAERHDTAFKRTKLLHGELADFRLGDVRVRMIKPASFMNLLGPVYLRALDVFDLAPEDTLALVDDFSLPFGKLRFRAAGSHGGHNGLRSIESILGAKDYPRLKLGIGPVPPRVRWADWVLKRYDAEQRRGLPAFMRDAADAVETWLRHGLTEAQNRHHVVEKPPPADDKPGEAAPPPDRQDANPESTDRGEG